MSNYLAIATVTATLYDILSQNAQDAVAGARVTMDRPSDMENDRSGRPRINLYLYQVAQNAAWRNADLPTRRGNGGLAHIPQAAMNLQYLLTFYGDETQFVPQRLLGKTVSTLHSHPLLTQQEINGAVRELVDAGQEYMRESNLSDQIEQVKFTQLSMEMEELSGFWSALYQVPYSLSVMYEASVVLIESQETPQPVLPVQRSSIQVLPFTQSVIEQVTSGDQEDGRIHLGTTIILRGRQLGGAIDYVAVGEVHLTPASVGSSQVTVVLSGELLPAGAQGVQIVYSDKVSSNVAPFVLHPRVLATSYSPPPQDSGDAIVTLETDVVVREGQRVALMLNEMSSQTPESYTSSLVAAPLLAGSRTIDVPVTRQIKPGATYLVRVQIDGAESPLEADNDPVSPTFQMYTSPTVQVP